MKFINILILPLTKLFRFAAKVLNFIARKLEDFGDRISQPSAKNTLSLLKNLPHIKPQVILYLSGLEDVAYQGNMWLPILEKLPCRVAIIIREVRIARGLHKTDIPIFYIKTFRELEFLEKNGVKTILYPGNPQKVTQSLRLFRLNHFFINHGESDKAVNQSKLLMAYDKLLVAGPLAKQRLLDANLPIREEQIEFVGRPQVELLLTKKDKTKQKIEAILYAPTWEGFVEEVNYTSVSPFGLMLLTELAKINIKIYFKPHPYTGHNKKGNTGDYLKEMINFATKSKNIEIVDANKPIFDYMNLSDLLISDISSVLNDYLYTEKPIILSNPMELTKETMHKNFPSSQAAYLLTNPLDIRKIINHAEKEDELKSKRDEIKRYSLGDIPDGYINRFKEIILSSVKQF